MTKQSLLIKTKDGNVLELRDFITNLKNDLKIKKRNDEKTQNSNTQTNTQIRETLSTSTLKVVTESQTDHKTPAERLEYQKRINKLRAKIQQTEYEEMTKNVTTQLRPGFGKMIQEIGSASKLAYSHSTIAISILASVLAFYFIPILLLPQTIPLGGRVICGLISATVILCVEMFYYARAFQESKIKVN